MKTSHPAFRSAALALLALSSVLPASAGTRHAAAPAAPAAPAGEAVTFQPKTKSVFGAAGAEHNPFWPIGWVKTEEASNSNVPATVPHASDFLVSTILLNDPPLAVINGKELAEGEVASVTVNGSPVTVQLMAVQDGRVVIRWQNQALTVPLHRNEVLSKGDAVSQTALR